MSMSLLVAVQMRDREVELLEERRREDESVSYGLGRF